MKRLVRITAFLWLLLLPLSCMREVLQPNADRLVLLPKGTPIMLNIGFGVPDPLNVTIATKAESSRADEARVHDLYVMLVDTDSQSETYNEVIYSRYFTYEHLNPSLSALDAGNNEGWYVENTDNSFGVVKIATEARTDCMLVLLANVSNTITSFNHRDAVTVLSQIETLAQLNDVRVTLEQEIVNRADLFLMMDRLEHISTSSLSWGSFTNDTPVYNLVGNNSDEYQLKLKPLDAKVKFWIKYNSTNIDPDKSDARRWQVFNVPSECFLMPSASHPSDITYFDTQSAFFEGAETINEGSSRDGDYQVFSFYMLENCQEPQQSIEESVDPAPSYYLREKESDPSAEDPTFTYAPENGTYVKFDLLLGLKATGVQNIVGDLSATHALTTEAMYTVHLGQFKNSAGAQQHDWDNYDVNRNTFYNYYITINNSRSIYLEVLGEDGTPDSGDEEEIQPGQEGSLLLSTDDVVNCDAHYEYHCLTFRYTPGLQGKKISWYVKTPFDEGGAQWIPDETTPDPNDGDWEFNCKDYLWVQFGLNKVVNDTYSDKRVPYPGNTHVNGWAPSTTALADGQLMDIHQLYNYILNQTKIRNKWLADMAAFKAGTGDDPGPYSGAFIVDSSLPIANHTDDNTTDYVDEGHEYVIRVTAFIDEYYYEKDPTLDPATATADPDLWRQFVNKDPRELHILSEANYSADGQSDVITSSHSIIQRSIQTFYNTYSPDLRTLWGTEHVDEMEYRVRHGKDPNQTPWPWWPDTRSLPFNSADKKPKDEENGRFNTAMIWGVDGSTSVYWEDVDEDHDGTPEHEGILDYSVDNSHPELKATGGADDLGYQYLAYSCLTRNRDNNGNGTIDPEEIRWYIASVDQLIGMWVGNEALSPSARIYQPEDKNSISNDSREWRAWVISSTAPSGDITRQRVIRAEEGGTKSTYNEYDWAYTNYNKTPALATKFTTDDRHQVSSVRCVRNIGTFNRGGETVDFSYADLSVKPDKYYESPAGFDSSTGRLNPNNDGTYTLRFSRLDPRSIREFTSEDLPYHEEYSMQNRVYLELYMQDPSSPVSFPASKTEEEINNLITSAGHNAYCPAGYRLPNMTEMLFMTALLPSSYWGGSFNFPCRTYYSRGALGDKKTESEKLKTGWGYRSGNNDRFNMFNHRDHSSPTSITGLRCVKDNNCTGEITGSISVSGGNKLHMGDQCKIKLNITSMGSAIKSLNLYLVYVNSSGAEDTRSIDIGDIKLSGVAIQNEEVEWTVPNDLTLLGNMTIRAVVINNAGTRKIMETPIRIISPVFASVRLLPCEYNDTAENPSFPVLLTVSSPNYNITDWRLSIKDPDNETTSVSLDPVDYQDPNHWSHIFRFGYTMQTLLEGTYSFQLEVMTADNVRTRSNIASMEILKVNYHPNPGTTGTDPGDDYHQATDITVKWEPDVVEGMSLAAGDFIEANMDVSGCTYLPVYTGEPATRNNDLTIGRDNLISIGITDTDHNNSVKVPYVYHIYYPAHDGADASGQDWLRPNVSTSSGSSNGTNYKAFTGGDGSGFLLQSGSDYKPDITKKQHFRLDREGAHWNGQWINPANSTWENGNDNAVTSIARILSSDTFYIGSTNGKHQSRARYLFVRAVHNSSESNAAGGGSDFANNPIPGGNL